MDKISDEEWVEYYAEWKNGKQTQREYCQKKKIKYITFREKIYALRKKGIIEPVEEKGSIKLRANVRQRFQELVIEERESKIELVPYCEIQFGEEHKITISSQESLLRLKGMLKCLTQA